MSSDNAATVEHPAPHRFRIGGVRLTAGLFGAPLAWMAQMSSSEPLAAYACYPHQRPLTAPLWSGLSPTLATISLCAFIAGMTCFILTIASWKAVERETGRDAHHTIDIGEGRTKFLVALGLMSGTLFNVAIVFTACAYLLVSPCGG